MPLPQHLSVLLEDHLEGISSHLAQMSTWTPTMDRLEISGQTLLATTGEFTHCLRVYCLEHQPQVSEEVL